MYVIKWDGLTIDKSSDYEKAMEKYLKAREKYEFVELRETWDNGNSGRTICQSW